MLLLLLSVVAFVDALVVVSIVVDVVVAVVDVGDAACAYIPVVADVAVIVVGGCC